MGGSYFSHLDENYTNNQNNLNDKRKSTENYKVKKFKMNNKIDPEIILNSELQTNKEIYNKNLLNSSDLINENETNIQKGTILKVKPLNTDFNDETETVSDDEVKKILNQMFILILTKFSQRIKLLERNKIVKEVLKLRIKIYF